MSFEDPVCCPCGMCGVYVQSPQETCQLPRQATGQSLLNPYISVVSAVHWLQLGWWPSRGLLPGCLSPACISSSSSYVGSNTPAHTCGPSEAGDSVFWNVLCWLASPSDFPKGCHESRAIGFPVLGPPHPMERAGTPAG